jgi:hypothetical protein
VSCREVERAAAQSVLGLLASEALPSVAVSALAGGCDSPSLRILAGLTGNELSDANTLLHACLSELGLKNPEAPEAALQLSRDVARKVSQGETTPYAGARQIWRISLQAGTGQLSALEPFVYAMSEWDERPQDRELLTAMILNAAQELLARET